MHGSENLSVSGVTNICLMKRDTSPSHRVDQAVDCDLWNVVPPLFNGCAKLLDIGGNWNTLLCTSIQSIPNMEELGHVQLPGNMYTSLQHRAMHYHAET